MSESQIITFTVGSGQTIDQYAALELASGAVQEAGAVTDSLIGVAQDSATAGEKVAVAVGGVTKVLVNGNSAHIAAGDNLSCSTTAGVLIKHDAQTNTRYVAKAMEAATADGMIIWALIYPYQPQKTA